MKNSGLSVINLPLGLKYTLSIPKYAANANPIINIKAPMVPKKCIGLLPNLDKNHIVTRSKKP